MAPRAYPKCQSSCLPQTSDLTLAPADLRRGGRGDPLTIVSQSFSARNTSETPIAATPYRWSSHNWWSVQSGRSSRQFVAGAIRRGTTKKTPSYRQSPKARVSRLKKLLKRGSPNQVRQQQS